MMRRCGFTLLEVLAATVLAALIAIVCMPLFSRVLAIVETRSDHSVTAVELRAFAEQLSAAPETFGFSNIQEVTDGALPWPGDPERPEVTIQRLSASGASGADHDWLQLRSGGVIIHQWIGRASDEEDTLGTGS